MTQPIAPLCVAAKFQDPDITAKGEPRAQVAPVALTTLWVNTGTLCNLSCQGCYIESSPRNDRLVWFTVDDLMPYLAEISRENLPVQEIGFTGGEPFMNPEITSLLAHALNAGHRVLVLSNGLTPLRHKRDDLAALAAQHPGQITIRLSLDHHSQDGHEKLRGSGTFTPTLDAAAWLSALPLAVTFAGRTCWDEPESDARAAYGALFRRHHIAVDVDAPGTLVLFPEMEDAATETEKVPEITTACWDILHKSPDDQMCASARMVVRRQGANHPVVLACTLIAYDPRFELGQTLTQSLRPVPLNHPHCARFCVLGGASCSR